MRKRFLFFFYFATLMILYAVQIASTFELKPQNDSAVDSAREAQVLSHLKAVTSYEILSPKRIKLLHENGWMEFEVKDDVF